MVKPNVTQLPRLRLGPEFPSAGYEVLADSALPHGPMILLVRRHGRGAVLRRMCGRPDMKSGGVERALRPDQPENVHDRLLGCVGYAPQQVLGAGPKCVTATVTAVF